MTDEPTIPSTNQQSAGDASDTDNNISTFVERHKSVIISMYSGGLEIPANRNNVTNKEGITVGGPTPYGSPADAPSFSHQ